MYDFVAMNVKQSVEKLMHDTLDFSQRECHLVVGQHVEAQVRLRSLKRPHLRLLMVLISSNEKCRKKGFNNLGLRPLDGGCPGRQSCRYWNLRPGKP